jgi:anaerobic magnesium-protoporphyrin IX monomethyl ester cyclase
MVAPSEPLRLAFVNLRARSLDWHHLRMVPLGIMVLTAVLRRVFGARVDMRLFDCTICPDNTDPDAAIESFLREFRPSLLGIRGFSSQADEFPIVARIAKQVDREMFVLAGGPHASTDSPSLYAVTEIDAVVPHEGEEVLVEIVAAMLENRPVADIAGLFRRGPDGRPIGSARAAIRDLDALPFPDYEIIDLDRYQGHLSMTDFLPRARFTSIFTSRGCFFRCTYCHTNFGKTVRYRSPENVLAEMEYLYGLGVREFHVIDDIFNADRKRALAIFDGIVRRGWRIHLAFPNGLRADLMDDEFLAAARAAGTYFLAIAVETATPRLQRQVKKFNKLDKVHEMIARSDHHGIFTCTFNMLGFPTETEAEMRATIDFTLASAAHLTHFFVVTPWEGTALHADLPRFGVRTEDLARDQLGYQNYAHALGSLATVPKPRIAELVVEAVQKFYFDARRLERMIELAPGVVQLALQLETRRWSAGYGWHNLPDARVRDLLAGLFAKAKLLDPARCAHLSLPAPASEVVAEA